MICWQKGVKRGLALDDAKKAQQAAYVTLFSNGYSNLFRRKR